MSRLLIVAARPSAGEAIRLAMRQAGRLEVLGYVNGRASADAAIRLARPDLILVDDMDCAPDAVARIREARVAAPQATIVLLAHDLQAAWLADAMDAGADALVSKAMHPGSLGTLVREIAAGRVFHRFVPPAAAPPAIRCDAKLTERELEVLRLMAAGAANSHIARQLWVTEQTVKFHLSNIYRKLGVANRTEASHYAHVHRLLEPEQPDTRIAAEAA
jgi:DNA-binding NarL/FixJ family response regulator